MSAMTEKMQKAAAAPKRGAKEMSRSTPKKGERFRCKQCGMELQITADCKCSDPDHVHLECCGKAMTKQ